MSLRLLDVVPECYVDTNVVQTILEMHGANHQKSCSMVLKTIIEKFDGRFAVGVIDKDKKEPPSLNRFSVIIAKTDELTLRKDPSQNHYVIQINHVMETFLLHCAKDINLDLRAEGFPNDLEGMKRLTKSRDSDRDPVVSSLVKRLSVSAPMTLLKGTLSYLRLHPYDTSETELRRLFDTNDNK
jgi:hypothetical protein